MSNNGKAKIFYHEIMVVWHNTVLQCGKKWAWPNKHFLACAACGLLPPRSKNPSYAPGIVIQWLCACSKVIFTLWLKLSSNFLCNARGLMQWGVIKQNNLKVFGKACFLHRSRPLQGRTQSWTPLQINDIVMHYGKLVAKYFRSIPTF